MIRGGDAAVKSNATNGVPAYIDPMSSMDINRNLAAGNASGDVHPLMHYFGQPLAGVDFDPRDRRWERNYTLPKAFEGQNVYLGSIVEGLVLRDATFYTGPNGLPIRRTPEMNFSFSEWHFDSPLLNPVPEEGVSRLVRSSYSQETATTRRYGLAFVVEHGFWKTAQGRTHYVRSLQQIANSTLLTINYGVIVKLLQCRQKDIEWQARHGLFEGAPEDLIEQHVQRFAALQKPGMAAELVVDKAKLLLQRRGIDPTTLLIPPETAFYFRGLGPDKVNYDKAGSLAISARTRDIRNISSFRGISVHQTQTFQLEANDTPPLDPLVRNRMIGEYHIMGLDMSAYARKPEDYTVEMRDIFIHNGNSDEMERIGFLDALSKCHQVWTGPGGTLNRRLFPLAPDSPSFQDLYNAGYVDESIWTSIQRIRKNVSADISGGGGVEGQVGGPILVHTHVNPEMLRGSSHEDVDSQLQGAVTPDTLQEIHEALDKINQQGGDELQEGDVTPPTLSEEEIKEKHAQNVGYLEQENFAYADAAKKYSKVFDSIKDVGKQIAYVNNVGAQIAQGEDAVKQNVIVNLDYLSGQNKLSKAYKKALEKLIPKQQKSKVVGADVSMKGEEATTQAADDIYTWTPLEGHQEVADWLLPCDYHTKEYCSIEEASIHPEEYLAADEEQGDAKRAKVGAQVGFLPIEDKKDDAKGVLTKFFQAGKKFKWGEKQFRDRRDGESTADYQEAVDAALTAKSNVYVYPGGGATPAPPTLRPVISIGGIYDRAITYQLCTDLAERGLPIPLNVMLARVHQEFQTKTAILFQGGRGTGETLLGESSVLLGDDVVTKRHYANMTLYFTSLVYKPSAVHIIDDICVHRYLGGRNCKFFSQDDVDDLKSWRFKVDNDDKDRPSILPLIIPCRNESRYNAIMDIRGTWSRNTPPDDWDPARGMKGVHYETAKFYWDELDFDQVNAGSFMDIDDERVNTTIIRGHSEKYNPYTGRFDRLVLSKGHFGRNVYEGMMDVLNGNTDILKDMDYETKKIHVIGSQLT